MKVSKLIALLKKMPQNLNVGFSHQDNTDYEVAGWAGGVVLFDKKDHNPDIFSHHTDRDAFESMPNRCVVIRG